jgi:hypothetical protein
MTTLYSNQPGAIDERHIDGKVSESSPPERAESRAPTTDAALRRAYVRGRRDERAGRREAPIATGLLVLTACAGAFLVALSIQEGSFTPAAQVVDQHIASATDSASRATKHAIVQVGDGLRQAGDQLKKSASG